MTMEKEECKMKKAGLTVFSSQFFTLHFSFFIVLRAAAG